MLAAAWASFLTWPLPLHLHDRLLGELSDGFGNVWLFHAVAQSLSQGQWPPRWDELAYSLGPDSSAWGYFGTPLLAAPIVGLFGPVVGANLSALANLTFSAWTSAALGRYCGASRGASLVAGLLVVSHPWYLQELYRGSYELAAWQWLALFLLVLVGVSAGRLKGTLLVLVGLLTLCFSWYLTVGALLAGVVALLVPPSPSAKARARLAPPLALLAVMTAISFYAPGSALPEEVTDFEFVPEARDSQCREQVEAWTTGARVFNPPKVQAFSSELVYSVRQVHDSIHVDLPPLSAYQGIHRGVGILVLLGLGGALVPFAGRAFWILLGVAAMNLALGPYLVIDGDCVGRLPWYEVLQHVPGAESFRCYRFTYPAVLAASVLAAMAVSRLRPRGVASGAFLLVGLVALGVSWESVRAQVTSDAVDVPRVHLAEVEIPEAYYWLRSKEADPGALAEWPVYPNLLSNGRFMLYQLVHGRPVMNYTYDRPQDLVRLAELGRQNGLMRLLLNPLDETVGGPEDPGPEDARELHQRGFAYLVLHRRVDLPEHRPLEASVLYGASLPGRLRACLGRPIRRGEVELYPLSRPSRDRVPPVLPVEVPRPAVNCSDPTGENTGGWLRFRGTLGGGTKAPWQYPFCTPPVEAGTLEFWYRLKGTRGVRISLEARRGEEWVALGSGVLKPTLKKWQRHELALDDFGAAKEWRVQLERLPGEGLPSLWVARPELVPGSPAGELDRPGYPIPGRLGLDSGRTREPPSFPH